MNNNSIEFGNNINIVNAKIKFTQSGIEDNDNLMMQIGFEIAEDKLVCTNKLILDSEKMKSILNILELRNWEELPKKYARIGIQNNRVVKIGNIIQDKWIKL